jgi:flagellar biosynthetic protein FlhB
MADAQDRHLPASERRLRKAREDGQVPRSRDLSHFAVFALGGSLLVAAAPALADWMRHLLESGLRFDAALLSRPDAMTRRLAELALGALLPALGFGLAIMALTVGAAVASGGWNLTFKPLLPQLHKLNPLSGLGRMFSRSQLGDTLKACLLASLLATVGAAWLRSHIALFHDALAMSLREGRALMAPLWS